MTNILFTGKINKTPMLKTGISQGSILTHFLLSVYINFILILDLIVLMNSKSTNHYLKLLYI